VSLTKYVAAVLPKMRKMPGNACDYAGFSSV